VRLRAGLGKLEEVGHGEVRVQLVSDGPLVTAADLSAALIIFLPGLSLHAVMYGQLLISTL